MKTKLLGNKVEAANTGTINSIYFIREGLKKTIPSSLLSLVSYLFDNHHIIMVDIENIIEGQLDVNWDTNILGG